MKPIFKRFYVLLFVATVIGAMPLLAVDICNSNFPSAQVADMFRYGEVETSLFTGRLNVSIPIYSLDDPDLNLDIALRYNSEGFKPRKQSGYVGYSWFLEAGGCITREVRNYADETCRQDQTSGWYMMGMLNFINRNSANVLNKDSVFAFDSSVGQSCYSMNNAWNLGHNCIRDVDYLPDIFHFNFCGYQGSFMIDNSGKPVIISGDYMKIDLSDLHEEDCSQPTNTSLKPLRCTSITLTSIDGYKYIFGGDLSSVGYTIALADGNTWAEQYNPVINTWSLKTMIAPNGRRMAFYYKSPTENNGYLRTDSLLELNEYHDLFAKRDPNFVPSPQQPTDPTFHPIKMNMVKTCILDSIVTYGAQPFSIHFFNRKDTHSLYKHTHYGQGDRPCVLDSIHIKSGDRLLRRTTLSYEYQSYNYSGTNNAHYWRFLKNVYISGLGTYTLSYNHETGTYQSLLADTGPEYAAVVDYYGFSVAHPLGAMLNRIDFPTGGRQEYTYERHAYSKERKYVISTTTQLVMETSNTSVQNISGARIQEIKTYSTNSGTTPEETKTYAYLPAPYSSFTGSSGIYYDNCLAFINNDEGFLVPDVNAYDLLETHIGYAYVEESTKDGANNVLSKVGYTFDVGKDWYVPDYNIHPDWANQSTQTTVYAALSGMLAYNNKLTHIGHLIAKDYFCGNSNLRSELYCYNAISTSPTHLIPAGRTPLGCTDTIVIFSHTAIPVARKLYVYPDVMQQHVTQDYDEGGYPSFINRCYLYDKKLRVTKEYTKDGQNEWLFTEYSYPDKFITQMIVNPEIPRYTPYLTGAADMLTAQHRINMPFEIVSGYEDVHGDEYITAGRLNLYDSRFLFINIDSIVHYAYLRKTLELALSNPITDYQPLRSNLYTYSYDSRYKLTCEYLFGASLHLIHLAPYGKIPTTYTWNGIYPATKTTGNQTYTYTYLPYVGLNSVTDPRGITTQYTYDKNGKLTEVFRMDDERKEIINSYQYHIITE